jgi:hypothetical protein
MPPQARSRRRRWRSATHPGALAPPRPGYVRLGLAQVLLRQQSWIQGMADSPIVVVDLQGLPQPLHSFVLPPSLAV